MSDRYREEVELLRAQVDNLLERFGTVDGLARPICWSALDAGAAKQAWPLLAGWVDWLIDRYRLAETVPACWYAHPPILEELAALRSAWLGAYCCRAAQPGDGVEWHDMLERVLVRIRDNDLAGCAAAGTHRADVDPPQNPDAIGRRAAAIRADIAARPQTADVDGQPFNAR
jgi:hypothetical protein